VSIGTNPHFDGVERRVEAHLLDFDGDLYGERLVVEIWSPLRGQLRFDSLDELVAAIGADVERTRAAVRPG
jgi:riboflavin kinase/FMN adenylyltransferase